MKKITEARSATKPPAQKADSSMWSIISWLMCVLLAASPAGIVFITYIGIEGMGEFHIAVAMSLFATTGPIAVVIFLDLFVSAIGKVGKAIIISCTSASLVLSAIALAFGTIYGHSQPASELTMAFDVSYTFILVTSVLSVLVVAGAGALPAYKRSKK